MIPLHQRIAIIAVAAIIAGAIGYAKGRASAPDNTNVRPVRVVTWMV
jgi:hypothetical protein